MNDTISRIETLIDEHFKEIGIEWYDLPIEDFDEAFADEEQARYGWTVPEVGMFCIERIAEQTAHLDDFNRECYVEAILWMIDRHVALAYERPHLGAIARHDAIESELYDIAPGSMTLMSEVEMRALDSSA